MEIKVDAENVATAGTILGGIGAVAGVVMAWARRQRAKGERWATLETRVNGHDQEFSDLKKHIDVRFDSLEHLIRSK